MWPPNSWALFAITMLGAGAWGVLLPFPWGLPIALVVALAGAKIDEWSGDDDPPTRP